MRRFASALMMCTELTARSTDALTEVQYATAVAEVQTAYSIGKALLDSKIAAGHLTAAQVATVQAGGRKRIRCSPALSSTTTPDTLADAQALMAAMPAGNVTTDATLALSVAKAALTAYQAAHAVQPTITEHVVSPAPIS